MKTKLNSAKAYNVNRNGHAKTGGDIRNEDAMSCHGKSYSSKSWDELAKETFK